MASVRTGGPDRTFVDITHVEVPMLWKKLVLPCLGICLGVGCSERSNPVTISDTYKLVYDYGPDLRIHIMNADGTGQELIGTFLATTPGFSPKGDFLAMLTNTFRRGPGGDSLVLLDLKTYERKDLAFLSSDSQGGVREYAWSPDGTKIAFVRAVKLDVREDLYVVNILTGELVQLTDQYRNHFPLWSSDSRTVSFERIGEVPYPYAEYFLIDWDGKNLRPSPYRVTGRPGAGDVHFNPNGQTVAFEGWEVSSQGAGTYIVDIYTMNVDGSNLRQLTNDGASARPNWSPDGRKIAFFLSNVSNGLNLYIMNWDGSGRRAITLHNNVYPLVYLWSPDGKKIAYAYTESSQPGVPHLHVVDIDDLKDTDTGVSDFLTFDWKPF
jgi:Tol biopolymer transport system component